MLLIAYDLAWWLFNIQRSTANTLSPPKMQSTARSGMIYFENDNDRSWFTTIVSWMIPAYRTRWLSRVDTREEWIATEGGLSKLKGSDGQRRRNLGRQRSTHGTEANSRGPETRTIAFLAKDCSCRVAVHVDSVSQQVLTTGYHGRISIWAPTSF